MHSAHAHSLGGLAGRWFDDPRIAHLRAMGSERGRGGGRHRHGPPPWRPGGFGGPGPGPGGRRRRMRRGDVRSALLLLLDEQPYNGYGLMQEIESRSDGVWRPSPGSVYPALSQLEDEGLVRSEDTDGRKRFVLTDEGRAHVEEHRERLGEPWKDIDREMGEGRRDLFRVLWQLGSAAQQVVAAGTDAQVAQARDVLKDARRSLYRILAEEDRDDGGTDAPDDAAPPQA